VSAAGQDWGVDSEFGRLTDVLLGPPRNFRWLPTSAISRATIDRGAAFDSGAAQSQHAEMVSIYEDAGVRGHHLEPDPALPYQVFARDSSTMTAGGSVVTQMHQWWRRGEYAAVIEFLRGNEIPVRGMITAGALEGGDVIIVEPGVMLIGCGEERTQHIAASQLAGWMREDGWEVRVEPIPARYVHIDVLCAVLAPKLASVCVDVLSANLLAWLREKGFELIEFTADHAFQLGGNAISLGDDRVLSSAGADELNDKIRAHGITVHDPDLSMFTLGGGGAHCLAMPLRRERMGG
jgi:N-dimethylarginine dimethylaminohydrolase